MTAEPGVTKYNVSKAGKRSWKVSYFVPRKQILRPGSDAVLHMSRIEFNELSSCEVRRLNQLETADIIRIGLAVLHAWLSPE